MYWIFFAFGTKYIVTLKRQMHIFHIILPHTDDVKLVDRADMTGDRIKKLKLIILVWQDEVIFSCRKQDYIYQGYK